MSGVSDSMQFFLVVVLLITIGFTFSFIGNYDKSVQTYELLTTKSGPFMLRRRFLFWMKQVFLLINVTISTCVFIVFLSDSMYVPMHQTTLGIMSSVLFIMALCAVLYLDSIDNLSFMRRKLMWMVSYLIVTIYSTITYMCAPTYWHTLLILMSSVLSLVFAILCAVLDVKTMQIHPPNAEYTCGLFEYLTFSYLNKELIQLARERKILDYSDVPSFVDEDSAEQIWDRFKLILSSYQNKISLRYSLFLLVQYEWYSSAAFQFVGTLSRYAAPLALERILLHISNGGSDDDEVRSLFPISIQMAVVILFVGPLVRSVADGQNYAKGRLVCRQTSGRVDLLLILFDFTYRHIGCRVRAALIGAIYSKALSVDLAGSKESVGKLNNLISVDVGVSSLVLIVSGSVVMRISCLYCRTSSCSAATRTTCGPRCWRSSSPPRCSSWCWARRPGAASR
jgi:hypothetical protein